MKPVMFCRNTSGVLRRQHISMKWVALSALSEKRNTVVREDAHRVAHEAREAAHERRPVERLELAEAAAVHDAGDHLAHVVGPLEARGHDAAQLARS